MTTKREWERRAHLAQTLTGLGFTAEEVEQLRRISNTLQRWHELECGTGDGCIERDEKTGRAYWLNAHSGRRYPIQDRETGAKKRLAAIIEMRNAREWHPHPSIAGEKFINPGAVSAYIQTDPRGAALYILRPGDVPAGEDAGSYYSRGICVY